MGKIHSKSAGFYALLATIIIWSTPALFQYWLHDYFDVWTQNFYRYLAAIAVILPMAWRSLKRESSGLTLKNSIRCLFPAIPNASHQIFQTLGVVALLPGLYSIIGRSCVIFTAIFAMILFADERWILRSSKFLTGMIICLTGSVLIVLFKDGDLGTFNVTGFSYAMMAILSWASYGVLLKKSPAALSAPVMFVLVAIFTALLLLPLMLMFGDPGAILTAPPFAVFILVLSGALCIGVGHALWIVSIRELGATFSQSLQLLCPIVAIYLSHLLFQESINFAQGIAAAAIIAGSLLVLRAKPPLREVDPE